MADLDAFIDKTNQEKPCLRLYKLLHYSIGVLMVTNSSAAVG